MHDRSTNRKILVWGATPSDRNPLFDSLDSASVRVFGPRAGQFREHIKQSIQGVLGEDFLVIFSEDPSASKFNHHHLNAGLYEPKQIEEALAVVMILPGARPMAVNTWELTLACELALNESFDKLILICPETFVSYLRTLFLHDVEDPKNYIFSPPSKEPMLGPQNSFAARWLYLTMVNKMKMNGPQKSVIYHDGLVAYDDVSAWRIGEKHSNDVTSRAINRIQRIVSK